MEINPEDFEKRFMANLKERLDNYPQPKHKQEGVGE